jgi:hypothetical protein
MEKGSQHIEGSFTNRVLTNQSDRVVQAPGELTTSYQESPLPNEDQFRSIP